MEVGAGGEGGGMYQIAFAVGYSVEENGYIGGGVLF